MFSSEWRRNHFIGMEKEPFQPSYRECVHESSHTGVPFPFWVWDQAIFRNRPALLELKHTLGADTEDFYLF